MTTAHRVHKQILLVMLLHTHCTLSRKASHYSRWGAQLVALRGAVVEGGGCGWSWLSQLMAAWIRSEGRGGGGVDVTVILLVRSVPGAVQHGTIRTGDLLLLVLVGSRLHNLLVLAPPVLEPDFYLKQTVCTL